MVEAKSKQNSENYAIIWALGKGRRYSFYGGESNAEERSSSLLSRLHKALPSEYRCKRPSARSHSRTRRQTLEFLYKETD